jgi:hypothetical protein
MRRIGRWTFNATAAISLLLCAATVAMWVRSYYRTDLVQTWGAPRHSGRISNFEFGGELMWCKGRTLTLSSGVIRFDSYDGLTLFFQNGPPSWSYKVVGTPWLQRPVSQHGGVQKDWDHFGMSYSSIRNTDGSWSKLGAVSFGYPVGVFLILPATWLVTWRRRRALRLRAKESCSSCGCNLTGNISGICPECGTTITPIRGTP